MLRLHTSKMLFSWMDQNKHTWVVILLGSAPNTQSVGARITIEVGGAPQMREVSVASNYVSQNPTVQHFGIGAAMQVDVLTVQWPDGDTTVLNDVPADQLLEIAE